MERLRARAGLSVPHEWWSSAALLKSYEAAGFGWVQLHSPPTSVLRAAGECLRHAGAVRGALETTALDPVLHAPGDLRVGGRDADRAFQGLLSYASEIGASQVVYHARALPDSSPSDELLRKETASLAGLAWRAEQLGVTIAVENLTPVYPGPETISAVPFSLRGLVQRIGSEHLGICLDVGHAHVTADARHTSLERLIEPVLDLVTLFHVHDNLGARRRSAAVTLSQEHDPLRLDLHLPPGRGNLPFERIAGLLNRHRAPLVLEVHPPNRPPPEELYAALTRAIGPGVREPTPV